MPRGESFWNPYRWVELSGPPTDYDTPRYHHKFAGIAGNIVCRLTTLTPLFVNDGQGKPCQRGDVPARYIIPGTSLKGVIRSLAEIVGNGCGPFASNRCKMDREHCVDNAAEGDLRKDWRLDLVARTFGLLRYTGGKSEVFRGHVRISDAVPDETSEPIRPMKQVKLVGASPKPKHSAFYPDRRRRKLYHHQHVAELPDYSMGGVSAKMLFPATPLPPGCTFRFEVNFWNLAERELALLLYCLFLEEEVTVQLSKEAAGGQPRTISGPMRHKIGGAKPFGAGSVAIEPVRMRLCTDLAARYRGTAKERWEEYEGEALRNEVRRRTSQIRARNDQTMKQLRAMLVFSDEDPRGPFRWPPPSWFDRNSDVPLKPTT